MSAVVVANAAIVCPAVTANMFLHQTMLPPLIAREPHVAQRVGVQVQVAVAVYVVAVLVVVAVAVAVAAAAAVMLVALATDTQISSLPNIHL